MKRILFFGFGLLAVVSVGAQDSNTSPASGPVITFEKATHDFGDISAGDKVEHIFKFTNTGTEPLIITNIQVTCGCTAPEWPRQPIPPGQKGEIRIAFNSTGKAGKQVKPVTVMSNAPSATITFHANVIDKVPN
jgi:hypothetical protein